jgi:hypothetical protein
VASLAISDPLEMILEYSEMGFFNIGKSKRAYLDEIYQTTHLSSLDQSSFV